MKEALGTIAYVAPEARLHVGTEAMETKKHQMLVFYSWDLMGGTGIEYDIMGYLSNNVAIVGIKTTTTGI
jgi:hypothetical protein